MVAVSGAGDTRPGRALPSRLCSIWSSPARGSVPTPRALVRPELAQSGDFHGGGRRRQESLPGDDEPWGAPLGMSRALASREASRGPGQRWKRGCPRGPAGASRRLDGGGGQSAAASSGGRRKEQRAACAGRDVAGPDGPHARPLPPHGRSCPRVDDTTLVPGEAGWLRGQSGR